MAHNNIMTKKQKGRVPLPPDERQSEFIKERVKASVKAAYLAKGGKLWLLKVIARKPRG